MTTRRNLVDRVKSRQESAIERQEARDKRTDRQQLDLLVKRGHGHCKEAEKLRARLNKTSS